MNITLDQIIVWLIVGALSGSLVGMLVNRSKEGFGWFTNMIVGLIGAVIGGVLSRLFGLDLGLSGISVSLEDLVVAVAGSLILLLATWAIRRARQRGAS